MRLKMVFKLKKEELDIEYRRAFLSLLKHCFQLASLEVYEKFYGNGTPMKPFTFGVYLPQPKFNGDTIQLSSNEITLNFSTYYTELGMCFYNSMVKRTRLYKEYPLQNGNSLRLHRVTLQKEKMIHSNEVLFKTLTPFLIRRHNSDKNKDSYLTNNDEDFIQETNKIVGVMLKELMGKQEPVNFIPIKIANKILIKHFGFIVDGNIGTFKLTANPEVLDFIYRVGIGSRRSEGFGLLEVLDAH